MAQKSLLLLTLMVVIAISGCASSPTRVEVARAAMGQRQESVPAPAPTVTYTPVWCNGGPKYFSSAKDCEIAMQSGECSYYTPRYIGERGKNPVDNNKLFLIQMEEPVCVKTPTVKGVYWVAQPAGTEFRFGKEKDGTFSKIPYALHACGNRVMDIFYPQPKKVVYSAPPPPAQARNACAENGFYGEQIQGGEPVCFEKPPWYAWENIKIPVYIVAGTIIVAGAVYCIVTGRCSLTTSSHPSSGGEGGNRWSPTNPGGAWSPTNPGGTR